jgi:hypothetical protein
MSQYVLLKTKVESIDSNLYSNKNLILDELNKIIDNENKNENKFINENENKILHFLHFENKILCSEAKIIVDNLLKDNPNIKLLFSHFCCSENGFGLYIKI